ncbi:MAG: 2-oxo acid dehydrogenase subunit E2 [Saprospiraceae bacterium]|nr:2-oxo acid dehydrogenase subunit E2 [Saprospiraceae bacterium]
MAKFDLVMPKLGESIMEATILGWKKNVGDYVDQDETILEIATDKVDSEVPSPLSGTIAEILFKENDVVPIGTVIARISTEAIEAVVPAPSIAVPPVSVAKIESNGTHEKPHEVVAQATQKTEKVSSRPMESITSDRFYSPLVRTIAKQEGISSVELDTISGSGNGGRVTKTDILDFVENKKNYKAPVAVNVAPKEDIALPLPQTTLPPIVPVSDNVEIVEMDRMRRLIADHMVMSRRVAPHVTSFVEADVTNLVNWRNRVKADFQKKYGENITFTPIFIEAICIALREYPLVNSSVNDNQIIVKKDLNIGMAAALPSGNLIVPVIKNADRMNLMGLSKAVNDLATRARSNKLKPDETQGGTFTLTNVGGFGNIMGTPIINQPQVAILATGTIKKKPAVIETDFGDVIAVRQIMYLSMSYDHRIVDGSMGGMFLRRVGDLLEQFDVNRTV